MQVGGSRRRWGLKGDSVGGGLMSFGTLIKDQFDHGAIVLFLGHRTINEFN